MFAISTLSYAQSLVHQPSRVRHLRACLINFILSFYPPKHHCLAGTIIKPVYHNHNSAQFRRMIPVIIPVCIDFPINPRDALSAI